MGSALVGEQEEEGEPSGHVEGGCLESPAQVPAEASWGEDRRVGEKLAQENGAGSLPQDGDLWG